MCACFCAVPGLRSCPLWVFLRVSVPLWLVRRTFGSQMFRSTDLAKLVTSSSDAYAAWAPTYPPHAHNALMEVEQTAMLELLPPVSGRTVLDAGCGTGRYIRLLAALGARAIGVDLSHAMVCRALSFKLPVVRADMTALPLATGSCDIVVSGLAIPDVPHLARVTAEWARVLRHRGVVVYSTLHPIGKDLGWRRTYESGDGTRTLPAYWHSSRDHHDACVSAGLEIETVREPGLTRDGSPVAMVVRARRHK
jgi:malonyl-CoA O-methyltransferase